VPARRGDPRHQSARVLRASPRHRPSRRLTRVAATALVDARHRRWITAAIILTATATALYVPYRRAAPNGPTGSSALGLAFGVAAALLILFEVALNLRKRVPTWRVGRAETWLKGHIWLGLVALPLVLFHSGFRFHGALAVALSAVFFTLVASGMFGLVLQQVIPRLMTERAPGETIYEQIPHVVGQLRLEAYEIAAETCGPIPEAAEEMAESDRIRADPRRARRVLASRPLSASGETEPLRRFYLEVVRPFLQSDGRRGPFAAAAETDRLVEGVRRMLPDGFHERVRDLAEIAAERRDLAIQRRLHHWLHGWLFVHVPLTAALLVLLAAHAVMALRYSF
jgi:hypothetical protein